MSGSDLPAQPSEDRNEPPADDNKPEDTRQLTNRVSRSRYKIALLGAGLMIALGGVLAAVLSNSSGAAHQTASNGSQSVSGTTAAGKASAGAAPAPQGTSRTTDAPAGGGPASKGISRTKDEVVSAAKLAEEGGALSLPESMQSQVIAWQSGAGGAHLVAVSSAVGTALQAGGVREYSLMKRGCAQLAVSVATATGGPQIPDVGMQNLYAKALAELSEGAKNCQAAISIKPNGDEAQDVSLDSTVLKQSLSELSVGARDVFRSTAEIQIASRQHH